MTEKEKMLRGMLYDADDSALCADRVRAKELCQRFNQIIVIHAEKLHRRCPRIGKRAEDVEHRTESQLLADCSHMFH